MKWSFYLLIYLHHLLRQRWAQRSLVGRRVGGKGGGLRRRCVPGWGRIISGWRRGRGYKWERRGGAWVGSSHLASWSRLREGLTFLPPLGAYSFWLPRFIGHFCHAEATQLSTCLPRAALCIYTSPQDNEESHLFCFVWSSGHSWQPMVALRSWYIIKDHSWGTEMLGRPRCPG